MSANTTSVNLDQMDLVVAILANVAKQHPDFAPNSRQMNSVIDAANLVVREFAIAYRFSMPEGGAAECH